MVRFSESQLSEIGSALEASGHPFIWVVRKGEDEEEEQKCLSQGCFGNGIIVREWAPQIQILEHPAVGGFVTHYGWNSVLVSPPACRCSPNSSITRKESEQTRGLAKQLGLMAKKTADGGGSSYSDLLALIQEIKACAFHQKMS
ncbi:UDP-glucose flavonoid 3-O-glucosyltransferase 7-like [Cornus florida]|uniref:UDP-glucose flavonoid 3-O-glucosyltransferase 7-like n=1 Tax=Cornus florida TaxID=4283 RepID=UPI002898906A|nr:UDP-glucose flavonoid 3-O-glucosyltransferase 7-like [Cornus florida]